ASNGPKLQSPYGLPPLGPVPPASGERTDHVLNRSGHFICQQQDIAEPCREFMICPLPRASEVSAFEPFRLRDRCPRGGGHGLYAGGLGAGHEGARDLSAGDERGHQLAEGGGDYRCDPPEHAALAESLRAVRLRRASRSTAAQAVEPSRSVPGGPENSEV